MSTNIVLPFWIQEKLPDKKTRGALEKHDQGYCVAFEDGEVRDFDSIADAYDYYRDNSKYELVLSEGIKFEYSQFGEHLIINGRYMSFVSYETQLELLGSEYCDSLFYLESWKQEPDSFIASYNMLDQHPLFWEHVHEWYWERNAFWSDIKVSLKEPSGVFLEASTNRQGLGIPNRGVYYGEGETYQEAVVDLAKKVGRTPLPQ